MNILFLEKRMISLIEFLKKVFVVISYITQIYAHVFNKLSDKSKAIQITALFSFVAIIILSQIAPVLGLFTFVIGAILAMIVLFVILAIKNM